MMYKQVVIPFTPRKWQRDVFKKLKRFSVLVIHRGAGKTVLSINYLIKKALLGPENARYAYVLPFRNQAERVVWKVLKFFTEGVPNTHFNGSALTCTFPGNREIMLLGADNLDALRGIHLHGMVLDEYSEMPADTWDTLFPTTTNHAAFVIWIGTPKGRNSFFDKYQEATDPSNSKLWYGVQMKWSDTNALPEDSIEIARKTMAPHMFEQEMECSFNAAITGSYYGQILDEIAAKQQIGGHISFDPNYAVHTAWDLGIRDAMSVWFFQKVYDWDTKDEKIVLIDYQQETGLGFGDWVTILNERAQTCGYRYGHHFAPHDTRNRELGTGITRLEAAAQIGLHFDIVPTHQVMDGIFLVRKHLPQCWFDLSKTSVGLEHLRAYRAKKDKNGMGLGPLHDEASHCADAFRYLMTGAFMDSPTAEHIQVLGW